MGATLKVWAARREKALSRLQRGTTEPSKNIQARVWERDGGCCQVCGIDLSGYPQLVTLGHRVDRTCGGSDSDVNLEIECEQCNRRLKSYHSTLADYYEWRADFRGRMMATIEDEPEAEPQSDAGGWWSRWLRIRAA